MFVMKKYHNEVMAAKDSMIEYYKDINARNERIIDTSNKIIDINEKLLAATERLFLYKLAESLATVEEEIAEYTYVVKPIDGNVFEYIMRKFGLEVNNGVYEKLGVIKFYISV